jgi:transcriptional regulator with XRE-family HTH domain
MAREKLNRSNQEPLHLKWAREARGLSQAELARAIGKPRSLINEMEAGTRNATPAVMLALASALSCPLSLLERRERPAWAQAA